MAGLLDGWGDFIKTPEGQGLLSAAFGGLAGARKGQPINSIGRAGLAGLSGYTGAEDRALQLADSKVKRGYMQSQIDENASQNATRAQTMKRQQEQDAYFMGTPGAGLLADAPTSPGAFKPSVDGMGPVAPMPTTGTAPSMGKFDEWSAQFGIPKDALLADYRANGGKGIADMLYKRGAPDMTVSNGYIFDKNRQGAGFLPSLSTSQSGQTSMTRIGPDGLPVVSAPQGALDVYGAYKTADAGLKPIKVFNPVTQREEYRTEADVVRPPQPATPRPQSPMAPRTGDSDQKAIFGQELTAAQGRLAAAKTPEEKTRAQSDIDGLGREMSRLGLSASGNFAAGPSTSEAAAAKASEAKAVDTAKADVVRDTATQKKEMSAGQMIAASQRARELLGQSPTGSGIGDIADKTKNFFGVSSKGAEVAAKLDIVAGDLVNNVPRMEGPQSDGDRIEYKIQAGRVADRTIPTEQRIAAAHEVERLQAKYAKFNGGTTDNSKPTTPAGQAFDTKPPAQQFKGKTMTGPDGKRYQSDGMMWKAVQ